MKLLPLSFILLFLPHPGLWAQDARIIRVKAGADARKVIPVPERYRYANFQPGTVAFYNGSTAKATLNYSVLLGEMHFIDPTGDTLSLANEQTIKRIDVGSDVFYYDPKSGFLEVVADYSPMKLAIKREMKIVAGEREGGYNQSSGASAIRTYKSLATANGQVQRLEVKGDMLLTKDEAYFLIDGNNQAFRADKSGIQKAFPKHRKEIDAYLKAHDLNLRQEQDLKQLLQFCRELA
ncbi:hypothetical protein GCM10023189_20880 [Nibrella saemangeumensis]|uniref:FecR family protein n=1 Tax=Nibrella saemangeumensis TaxID=1084526 RepID=A0ABP8MQK2_9BACT